MTAYNRAINAKRRELGDSYVAMYLPENTSVAAERESITTAAQLNYRINSMRRILKSENPDALEWDYEHGMFNYTYHEGVIAKAMVNRYRIGTIKRLGGSFKKDKEGNWKPEDAFTRSLINETNYMPVNVDVTAENVGELLYFADQYSSGDIRATIRYYKNYMAQFEYFYKYFPEHEEVLAILEELIQADPNVIHDVFVSYDYYGTFEYMYPKYDRTPMEEKIINIHRYWVGIKNQYLR